MIREDYCPLYAIVGLGDHVCQHPKGATLAEAAYDHEAGAYTVPVPEGCPLRERPPLLVVLEVDDGQA
jgi:hypothetical protein